MKPDNVFYQLALRPFHQGAVDVATLVRLVEECVAKPPILPLPENQAYAGLLEGVAEMAGKISVQFQSFLLLLSFLVAELWAGNRLVAVMTAHELWQTIEGDAAGSSLVETLLPALEKHPAYSNNPETHALISGLGGLLALNNCPGALSPETLDRLDQGIAFAGSGFVRHQLQGLLWTCRGPEPALPSWESLLERNRTDSEVLAADLQAVYPRAFFALRYHGIVKELLGQQIKALFANDQGAREILTTPGLDYLSSAEQVELRSYSAQIHQGALEFLHSCIQLLNRANALLRRDDSWALACPVKIATAELCLWGHDLTENKEFLEEAREFTLRAVWPIRHSIPLYFDHGRHLLAKIYRAWEQPARAQRLSQAMLGHLERYRGQAWFADLAAGTNAQLAQLALEQGEVAAARDHALAALDQAGHHLGGGVGDAFNLEAWSATLLDTAIAACISSGAAEPALGIFEQWQSAAALSRHLGLPPTDAATLRKNLPADTALVYLGLDRLGASLLLVTGKQGVEGWREEFGWEDLKQAIGPWLKAIWQLRSASPSSGRERLRNFQAAMDQTLCGLTPLLRPLAKALQQRNLRQVVLIPGRGLGGLPLHAVPLEDREDCFGDRFTVIYAPNATVWLAATRAQAARGQLAGFVGFASADSGFSTEIIQAASFWDSSAAPWLNATPAQFLQLAAETAVLHLSCHGWFRIAEREEGGLGVDAGLHLGGGRLGWRSLLQCLRLPRARMVVLSACESLLLSHREILNQQFGLPYAFLAAGAPLLLGSSWMVESTATTLLVTRFHHNIRREYQPASQALAEAQRWLRRLARIQVETILAASSGGNVWIPAGEHPYQHPYWWAGFRLIGADLREMPSEGGSAEGMRQGG